MTSSNFREKKWKTRMDVEGSSLRKDKNENVTAERRYSVSVVGREAGAKIWKKMM
jgi:hypothetical protein